MGSDSSLKLPLIDFSNLEIGTPNWDLVRTKVKEALEDFGCFEALFDKIPLELRKSVFDSLEELFNLPLPIKLKNVSKKPYHGYVGYAPIFESMGIEDSNITQNVESFYKTFWPEGHPAFSKMMQSYSEKLVELDQIIRRMVLESLGVEKYLKENLEETNYLFRMTKYSGPETNERKVGLDSHTDMNILTILHQNEVEGLEVQTKDGRWIHINPSPHSFIPMVGEFFHAWTNGRIHSPHHRVVMTGNEARYSTGLFSIPKEGYIIKAPEELVNDENPLLFKPFDHVQFLDFYYSEAGQKAESALKAYCGA